MSMFSMWLLFFSNKKKKSIQATDTTAYIQTTAALNRLTSKRSITSSNQIAFKVQRISKPAKLIENINICESSK